MTCPSAVTVSAVTSAGISVSFAPPETRKGEGTVTVACTPESGTTFPVGVTQAECVATDSLSRKASCTFSITVAAPPRLSRTRILAFGDSLTFGSTLLGNDPYAFVFPAGTSYPTVLGQLLSARYTDQRITVFNEGLVGEQAWRAVSRFGLALSGTSPDAVVLLEGYNDYRVALAEGTTFGVDNAAYGISLMAAEARRRGVRVFICTLTPGKPGRVQIPASVLEAINGRYRQIARAEGAVLVDLYAALLPDLNANVSVDGLHLTPLGYRRVAETVFAAIRADLEVK